MKILHTERFDTSIVITDPCYIFPNTDWDNKKFRLSDGNGIKPLYNIDTYLWNDTNYGDWCCSVHAFDEDTYKTHNTFKLEEIIGAFTADAGLVCVLSYDDAKRINPNVDEYIATGLATLINDFTGDVCIFEHEESIHVGGIGSSYFLSVQN